MSTKPYSLDLRKRVVDSIIQGKTYMEASNLFSVSISAIGRWYRNYKKEGDYKPKIRPGAKRKINIVELELYIRENDDGSLRKVSERFEVSIWTVHFWLKKLGFTYKKKPFPTWKQTLKSEKNI